MSRLDNIYQLHHALKRHKYPVSTETLCAIIGIKTPTLKHYVSELRNYYNAPLKNRRGEGYYYSDENFEIPGLWFSTEELEALIILQTQLGMLQPGLLDDALTPIRDNMRAILKKADPGKRQQWHRLRLLNIGNRPASPHFPTIARATLEQQRLHIDYYSRGRDDITTREISPQRITHYRDNWYLDAWCHLRDKLCSFSIDCIETVQSLEIQCKSIDKGSLNRHYATAFGIFAGEPTHTAHLLFTPFRARWVATENWHPEQQHRWHDDGSYELIIPYNKDIELIMEICKYATDVKVLSPPELKLKVQKKLLTAAQQYKQKF